MTSEIKIDIKPLSVNKAWRGRRFKTDEYKAYQSELLYKLPENAVVGDKICAEFGFSNKNCDIDNPVKLLLDTMQLKYGFNDKSIIELNLKKVIVKKGKEYIKINLPKKTVN